MIQHGLENSHPGKQFLFQKERLSPIFASFVFCCSLQECIWHLFSDDCASKSHSQYSAELSLSRRLAQLHFKFTKAIQGANWRNVSWLFHHVSIAFAELTWIFTLFSLSTCETVPFCAPVSPWLMTSCTVAMACSCSALSRTLPAKPQMYTPNTLWNALPAKPQMYTPITVWNALPAKPQMYTPITVWNALHVKPQM